jgi:uncharacterized protein (TIGR02996 family)
MSEADALLAAILDNPTDDTPRRIYADWLQEQGQDDRAEFIRVQVELARREKWPEELVRRESQLRNHCMVESLQEKWFPGWKGWSLTTGAAQFSRMGRQSGLVSRGFISAITCSWEDFQKHADSLIWWGERTCEICLGEGAHVYHYNPDGSPWYSDSIDCGKCRGKGVLPGATMGCLVCKPVRAADAAYGFGHDYVKCRKCGDPETGQNSTGRIPRPMPATAQPIEEVTITDWRWDQWQGQSAEQTSNEVLCRHYPTVRKWNLPGVA